MSTNLRPYRLSLEAYHSMREAGILTADDRVELIRGQIVAMSPKGSKHSSVLRALTRLMYQRVADKVVISVQNPVSIPHLSEPEPDLSLLIPPESRYEGRHPEPADTLLVIEIADSSLTQDRVEKASLYAQAGIPEYWIVNLQADEIERHQQPLETGYKTITRFQVGEMLPLPGLGAELAVAEVFGQ